MEYIVYLFFHRLHFFLTMLLVHYPKKECASTSYCLLPIATACSAKSAEIIIVEYIVYRFSSPLTLFTGLGIGSFSNKVNLL